MLCAIIHTLRQSHTNVKFKHWMPNNRFTVVAELGRDLEFKGPNWLWTAVWQCLHIHSENVDINTHRITASTHEMFVCVAFSRFLFFLISHCWIFLSSILALQDYGYLNQPRHSYLASLQNRFVQFQFFLVFGSNVCVNFFTFYNKLQYVNY